MREYVVKDGVPPCRIPGGWLVPEDHRGIGGFAGGGRSSVVEFQPSKLAVVGSNPIARSIYSIDMQQNSRIEYFTLLIILACAFLLRFSGAANYYFHTDELMHFFIAKGNGLVDVFNTGMRETQPPLGHFIRYYLLLINDSIIFSRLVSITCGIISIIAAFGIGKQISKNYYGLAIAILFSFAHIAVIYTTSTRNYSFFLMFLMLGYYFFTCFLTRNKNSDLYKYLLFTLLAIACHFSGYIFTFSLSLTLFLSIIANKQYRILPKLILGHIPHLIFLGGAYYFYYLRSDTADYLYNLYETLAILNPDPLLGTASFYYGFFARYPLSFLIGFPLTVYGVFSLWRINKFFALSIIIAFILQLALTAFKIYPMVGSRYCLYFFPFIALGLGKFIDDIFTISKLRREYVFALIAIITLAYTAYAIRTNIYFNHEGEFDLPNQNLVAGLEVINKIPGEDLILTNKGTWLHLLYQTNKDHDHHNGYYPVSFGEYKFGGRETYFWEARNFWEFTNEKLFGEYIAQLKDKIKNRKKIWVVVLGSNDYAISSIYTCPAFKPYIKDEFIEQSVLVFSLETKALYMAENLENCLKNSKQPHFGAWFDKTTLQK